MTLPQSVQNQIKQADALQKEAYANPEPADGQSTGEPSEQPATPAEPETTQSDEPEATASTLSPQEIRDATYYRHRFEVIQGKYNAELPPLREENSQLKAQVGQLEEQIKELSAQQQQQAAASPDTLADARQSIVDSLSAEEREEYGDDLITLMAKIALGAVSKSAAPPQLAKDNDEVKAEIARLKQDREAEKQAQADDRDASFLADLTARVPDWQALQNAPQSQEWLRAYDQSTKKQYNDRLQQAAAEYDMQTVLAMFEHMRKLTTQHTPKPKENQVQPNTSRATNDSPTEGRTWSGADITKFYRDKSDGKYSKEEGERLERDIFQAQKEGRIV